MDADAFPDLQHKLNAPVRKSAFERAKEEAEAKRRREEIETAAALKEFEQSFADDGDSTQGSNVFDARAGVVGSGFRAPPPSGPGKRHFASGRLKNGPGTLLPLPGTGKKRAFDGKEKSSSFHSSLPGDKTLVLEVNSDEDDDPENEQKAAPRPTMHLSDLPVGTTQEEILSLLAQHVPRLRIDTVQLLPPLETTAAWNSTSAIVTLAEGTVNKDIDAAITTLQRLYVGLGHRLSISRHVSSNLATSVVPQTAQHNARLPFGASAVEDFQATNRHNMAAPPPAGNFRPGTQTMIQQAATVHVKAPTDLRQLKLINKTLEGMICHGPEFEAALMQRPEVRSEEKWSWLFDSCSVGGVYFRWRLWYLASGRFAAREEQRNEGGSQGLEVMFEDEAPWQAPDRRPRFERVSKVEEFLSDPEYDESEEELSDNEESKKAPELSLTGEPTEAQYLNPLLRARITHLLARLPASPATLRKGDIARVSAFAFRHAGQAAEEIARILVSNIRYPLSLTDANPDNHPLEGIEYVEDGSEDGEMSTKSDVGIHDDILPSTEIDIVDERDVTAANPPSNTKTVDSQTDDQKDDTTSSKLIALYVVSDVLHGCDTAGIRNTWKYKSLIERAIREQKIFEHLGRIERDLGWGRVKADRWKGRVHNVFEIWKGWAMYATETMQYFMDAFDNPPLTDEEKAIEEQERKDRETRRAAQKSNAPKIKKESESVVVTTTEPDRTSAARINKANSAPKREEGEGLRPSPIAVDAEEMTDVGKQEMTDAGDEEIRDAGDEEMKDAGGEDNAHEDMFGMDGSSDPRPFTHQDTAAATKPAVLSKGSQRPSTRMLLDGWQGR